MTLKTRRQKSSAHLAQPKSFVRLLNKKVLEGHLARTSALTLAGVLALASSAYAVDPNELPTGGTVVGGFADINYNGNNMTVTQSGVNRTVIDWNTFNIGGNASAEFQQMDMNSLTVNRVTGPGNDPSQILGNLRSTVNGQVGGRIMILDPNGVLFGQNAVIDVGGLVASTGMLNDVAGFMAGGPNTPIVLENTDAQGNAVVENRGRINIADGGMLALIAPTVRNSGIINARRGFVALAAGQHATLDFYGDNLINVALSGQLEQALVENAGPTGPFGRGGQIYADGGTVTLTAGAARSVMDSVVNMHGVIRANSFSNQNGRIVLSSAGQVNVSGRLEARSDNPSTTQPAISITGHDVNITADSHSILSGVVDGIFAGALTANGNGGNVYIWGTNRVTFAGRIDVRGGSNSGNGGNVEISGAGDIAYRGIVDASANNGARGTLTIDPSIVRIGNSMFDPVVNAQYLAQTLGLTNVHIIAGDRIILVDAVNLSHWGFGGLSVTQGDLTLEAPTVDLLHDLIMGAGNLNVDANTINLGGTMYRNTFPIYLSALNQLMTQSNLFGNASVVNVLGNTASIQQGIHLAGSGATVYVAAANYAENINIYKSLTLQGLTGPGGAQPLLFGTTPGGAVIMVSANNVTVDGFDIVAQTVPWYLPSLYAINAENVSGLTVRNTNMTGPFLAGLRMNNVTGAQIVNNSVTTSLYGILSTGGSNLNFTGNTILGNVTGMSIADATNVRLVANTVIGSLLNGIELFGGSDVGLSGNTVQASGQDGIHADGVSDLFVYNNTVSLSGDDGIDVHGGDSNYVGYNTVVGSGDNGIEVSNVTDMAVKENTVLVSGNDGINIRNVRGLYLPGNTVAVAGGDGISVRNSSDIDAFLNSVGYVAGHGIKIVDATNLDLYSNIVLGAGKDGIHLSDIRGFDVSGNIVAFSGRDGIHAEAMRRGVIGGNTVAFSGRDGINLSQSRSVDLNGNTVAFSGDDGIDVNAVSNLGVYGNTVLASSDNGVEVTGSNGAQIIGNFIVGSARNGVFIRNSDNAVISGNAVALSGQDGIHVASSDGVYIGGNLVAASGRDGIHIRRSEGAQVVDNLVAFSGRDGVHASRSDGLYIAGNFIVSSGRDGIFLRNADGAVVHKNTVTLSGRDGIHAEGSDKLSIRGNTVVGSARDGVNVTGVSGLELSDNTISFSGRDGVHVANGQDVHISGNFIAFSARDGIFLRRVDRAGVDYNYVWFSGRDGISASDVEGLDVYMNSVAFSGDDGIDVNGAVSSYVGYNAVTGSGDNGIEVSNAKKMTVKENTVLFSGGDGINIRNVHGLYMPGNTVTFAGGDGIRLAQVSDVDAFINNVSFVRGNGISITDAKGVDLYDNTVSHARRNGIVIRDASGVNVNRNTVDNVGRDGIRLVDVSNANIMQNTVTDVGGAGIRVVGNPGSIFGPRLPGATNIVIGGNSIDDAYDGIVVTGASNVEIADNGVYNVVRDGIRVDRTAGVMIRNNAVIGYGEDGIQVSGSKGVNIIRNVVDGLGSGSAGIRLGANGDDFSGNAAVTIEGNTVRGNAIGLSAQALNNRAVNVFGNTFENNTVGLWASSGQFNLDQPGNGNIFRGGSIGMVFDGPVAPDRATGYTGLSLVGDTIGETVFEGQTQYYIDLRNGAFFDPGRPTIIDGTLATYDGVFGGLMTLEQLADIRAKINDYVDDPTLGLIFAGATGLDDNQILRRILNNRFASGRGTVIVAGMPATSAAGIGGNRPFFTAADLAGIAPAGGGPLTAEDLASLEPAAGGTDTSPAGQGTAPQRLVNGACWAQLGGGAAMAFDLGEEPSAVLNDQANCEI